MPDEDSRLDDTAVMSAEDHPEDSPTLPAVGDHVLYRLPTGPARGEYRSAQVTYVHGDGAVNLAVFCGLASDLPVFPVCPAEHVTHGGALGHYLWLNEVPA